MPDASDVESGGIANDRTSDGGPNANAIAGPRALLKFTSHTRGPVESSFSPAGSVATRTPGSALSADLANASSERTLPPACRGGTSRVVAGTGMRLSPGARSRLSVSITASGTIGAVKLAAT